MHVSCDAIRIDRLVPLVHPVECHLQRLRELTKHVRSGERLSQVAGPELPSYLTEHPQLVGNHCPQMRFREFHPFRLLWDVDGSEGVIRQLFRSRPNALVATLYTLAGRSNRMPPSTPLSPVKRRIRRSARAMHKTRTSRSPMHPVLRVFRPRKYLRMTSRSWLKRR